MVQPTNLLKSAFYRIALPAMTIATLLTGCSSTAAAPTPTTATIASTDPPATAPSDTAVTTSTTTATSTSTTAPVKPDVLRFTTAAGSIVVPKMTNGTPPPLPAGAVPFTADYQGHTIRGIDIPGEGPAVMLLHGFPDNLHLYDKVYPLLAGTRRVIAFDFLGWGTSDKPLPGTFEYTMAANQAQIKAVITKLNPGPITLVLHDASGIPGLDLAIDEPALVSRIVLLNTFYGLGPTQTPPTAINIYANPALQAVENALNHDPAAFEAIYRYQIGLFLGSANKNEDVDRLWSQFPESLPAFTALNDVLFNEVAAHTRGFARLGSLQMPVSIVFGALDVNLTVGVAKDLAARIPGSDLVIVDTANHFIQLDAPDVVAEQILRR
jgi:haloalkane dehalogenase